MACENLNPSDPALPNELATVALNGVIGAIAGGGLKAIPRAYVGVGPVPAEDCCPDIVVWVSNIRLWDGSAPDTLSEGRILQHFGVAFDINVRVGDCYWEMVNEKQVESPTNITKMSNTINKYGSAAFLGAVNALAELPACNVSVHPQSANPYHEGGCAGYTFLIGVSVV